MSIAASILFDAAYIEAALLTAYELRGMGDVLHRVHLVLLSKTQPDAEDAEAATLLSTFCQQFNTNGEFYSAITVKNGIPDFQGDHFSNAIVYKALLPSMLAYEPYLVNIDAGLLPGERMHDFLRELDARYCQPGTDQAWVLGAHCVDSAGQMPEHLARLPANSLYPAGNILLFNSERYRAAYFGDRLLHLYRQLVEFLGYAEQELICLTATEGELLALPRGDERITPFLGLDVLLGQAEPLPEASMRECVFFKFVGGLKPWKYWVLDPNKALYTRRRAALEQHFALSGSQLVMKHRHLVGHEDYRVAFLEAYDHYLSAPGASA
jgi:hypothetical protein